MVTICDELLRQSVFDKSIYTKYVTVIKMLITKRTYKKHYVIGGAGFFGCIGSFLARLFSSNTAKQLTSTALQAGKSAAKDVGMKAIDAGKTVQLMQVRN